MATLIQPGKTKKTSSSRQDEIEEVRSRIVKASAGDRITALIYARNKVGKTRWACSSGLKTLILDMNERGTRSVRKIPNVDVLYIRRWEEMDPIYWFLRSGTHDYEVLAIDTVTGLAGIGMRWVLKENYDRDMTSDILTPTQPAWGKLASILEDLFIKLRNLAELEKGSMHVIFLAQEKTSTTEDEESGTTLIETFPELSPKPRSALMSAVDIIGRMYVKEVVVKQGGKSVRKMERRMLLTNHPRYAAGTRFDELAPIERNPTMAGFLAKINGATKNADDL